MLPQNCLDIWIMYIFIVTSITLVELGSLPNAAILLLLSRIFFLTVTLSYYYHLGRRPKKIWEPRKHRYDTWCLGSWVTGHWAGVSIRSFETVTQPTTSTCFTWRWALPQGRRQPQGLYFNFSLHTTQEFAFSEQLLSFLLFVFFFFF